MTAASSSVTVVPVAPVFPSSLSGFGETVLSDSDCQFVESQTLHSPKKRDAPPASRKKTRGIEDGGEHRWTARD